MGSHDVIVAGARECPAAIYAHDQERFADVYKRQPDELAGAWRDGRVHLPLVSQINGEVLGRPNAGVDMNFSFYELLAHAARTRRLGAGTILGSGTVANRDPSRGCSCLAERRTLEVLEYGSARTPFLKFGDRVRIEMLADSGASIFGALDQQVVRFRAGL